MTACGRQKYHDRTYLPSFSNDPSYPLEKTGNNTGVDDRNTIRLTI